MEYIIHGTSEENLLQILKDGYIDNIKKKKSTRLLDDDTKQIFTQIIYKNILNQSYQDPHWLSCCIVLDKKILRDYPFYATCIGGNYNHFEKAFEKEEDAIYVKGVEKEEVPIYVKGVGNLKRIPRLTRLKKEINRYMHNKNLSAVTFIHSHEILFGQKIYLKDYCKCVTYKFFPNKTYDEKIEKMLYLKEQKLKKACLRLNIPFKKVPFSKDFPMKGIGINNFIKKVEE